MKNPRGRPPRDEEIDKITLRLEKDTGEFVRELAKSERRSLSAQMEVIVDYFRKKPEGISDDLAIVS